MKGRSMTQQDADTTQRPNIVFILSDQQRWDTLGCYGQPLNITPNLDAMARRGVQVETAISCQPVCGPARSALQTGRYPSELGTFTNHRMLPMDQKTLAHYLSEVGYRSAYIGKWHLASFGPLGEKDDFRVRAVPPERRGGYTDEWLVADALEHTSHSYDGHVFDKDERRVEFPEGRYRADVLTDWTLDYLDRAAGREDPFYLFLSYLEPHHQNDRNHYEGPRGSKERFADFTPPGDLVDAEGDWREEYPDYLGCVENLDRNLGRILSKLDERGVRENTLVIYTSDHGSHFRTRNGEYKRSCHEASVRVPMVLEGPGFRAEAENGSAPSSIHRGLVSLIDLPPTVLRAAGRDVPPVMRGVPLQDLRRAELGERTAAAASPGTERTSVFMQISEDVVGRAVRTARWKYAIYDPESDPRGDPGSSRYTEHCLYDLERDPHEQHNLVRDPEHADTRAWLQSLLLEHMEAVGEERPVIL
jgi:uncharacterized sulfatase